MLRKAALNAPPIEITEGLGPTASMFKGRLTWKKVAVIVIVPHLIYHPLRYFATKDRDKLRTDFEQRTFTESE
ncbi:hypothetical protein HPB47_026465 [Ixodes persulcatus]|uniref:Uncharacterized protein n=1 Tax=Ixodes persulcatus TaxID=34615 RepID=A0AC60Q0H2_IXOPE|nr:hypothetical protein HPB47_026465 [Ixodes persulcatus]